MATPKTFPVALSDRDLSALTPAKLAQLKPAEKAKLAQQLVHEYAVAEGKIAELTAKAKGMLVDYVAERNRAVELRDRLDERIEVLDREIAAFGEVARGGNSSRKKWDGLRDRVVEFLNKHKNLPYSAWQLQTHFPELKGASVALVLRVPVRHGIIKLDKSVQGRQNTRYYIS